MNHYGSPKSGTCITRICRQEAVLFRKCDRQCFFQIDRQFFCLLIGILQCKPRSHYLDTEVVFFVDHHTDIFILGNKDALSFLPLRQFFGDQMLLDERPSVRLGKRSDIHTHQVIPRPLEHHIRDLL